MTAGNSMFAPPNPEFELMVRDAFAKQGLMMWLGASLAAVGPGRAEIELPFSAAVAGEHGHFASAAVAAAGESAAACAALTLMPAGSEVATVDYKINYISPPMGRLLCASARVIRAGQSLTVARIDIKARAAGADSVCALLHATVLRVDE